MPPKVVGFEGYSGDSSIAWGAAAIRTGSVVTNSVTGHEVSAEEFDRLVESGNATALGAWIDIGDAPYTDAVVLRQLPTVPNVLKISGSDLRGHAPDVRIRPGTPGAFRAWFLPSYQQFEELRDTIITRAVRALYGGPLRYQDPAEKRNTYELVRTALLLDPHHPELNALLVHSSEDPEVDREIGEALLRTEEAIETFESCINGLQPDLPPSSLLYKGGIARPAGGMVMVELKNTTIAMDRVRQNLSRTVASKRRYLPNRAGAILVKEVKASSVELVMEVDSPEDETIGGRLLSYFTLMEFERALHGEASADLLQQPGVQRAIDRLRHPDAETEVSFPTRLAESGGLPDLMHDEATVQEDTPVLFCFIHGSTPRSSTLDFVFRGGATGGAYNRRAVTVRKSDNGRGKAPLGLEYIEGSHTFLYAPVVCRFLRQRTGRSQAFHLLELAPVLGRPTPLKVTWLPSAIVPGAFMSGIDGLSVMSGIDRVILSRNDQTGEPSAGNPVNSGDYANRWELSLSNMSERTETRMWEWARLLDSWVEGFELAEAAKPEGSVRYTPPARFRPGPLERLLVAALAVPGGNLFELSLQCYQRFQTGLSEKDLESAQRRSPASFTEATTTLVRLSRSGVCRGRVVIRASGDPALSDLWSAGAELLESESQLSLIDPL